MPQPRAPRFLTLVSLRTPAPPHHPRRRTIFDGTVKPFRDRGLDHAVERERNLKPLLSLKNLIKREPSKSLPVSLIKRSLSLPFRPIEFVRKHPSVFEEFLPVAAAAASPHVRLTPETLRLDTEENLLHHSDSFKRQAADRLLKLLMIARIHKIPLPLVEHLQWDLGLPEDFGETVVPDFPDYFRIADGFLELVCWDHDLAVSVIQGRNVSVNYEPLFPVQFSNGLEMDKKYEKWLREWQKKSYESPYENLSHLPSTSDESDVWVVGVLHEVLHLFVGKKIEKEMLLEFGEWLGLRSRFKRALLQHPGMFYVSSKIGTYTVVLREGYKRGALIEDHPVMNLRNQYVHLMNSVMEEGKSSKIVQGKGGVDEVEGKGVEGGEGEGEGDGECVEDGEEEACEVEDASETDFDDDEEESRRCSWKNATVRRGREFGKVKLDIDKPLRGSSRERLPLRDSWRERSPLRGSRRERSIGKTEFCDDEEESQRGSRKIDTGRRSREFGKVKLDVDKPLRDSRRERSPLRGSRRERSIGKTGFCHDEEESQRGSRKIDTGRRGREFGKVKLDVDKPLRDSSRERSPLRDYRRERSPLRGSQSERSIGKIGKKNSFEASKRRQVRGAHIDVENTQDRSRFSNRSSLTSKKTPVL
ncbi:Protein ROOT PRIMORDIUM DEFECTIVE 1 [Glycine soja]|uniref:Protein ROOT PRIMORDIUM DEFECTIVE 1 n=1 Tax=Glycine soja TaxID=3848 RepID=A0A445GJ63_GLYSO|nr:Protein ROOT PRIMORDIUM DEFECTIVE 1 [Glycine soja]